MIQNREIKMTKTKTPGEKQASIPFNLWCKQEGLETIFSNHASSAQTYFVDPQDKFLSIPKKIDKPDIIMRDKKRKVLYVTEAEKSQNMNKGIKQIQGWKNQKSVKGKTIPSLYDFLEAQYRGFEIKTGIVLSGVPKNKVDIAKGSSWGYTTNEGELCITKEFHEILGK
jgi:hypothetical protein